MKYVMRSGLMLLATVVGLGGSVACGHKPHKANTAQQPAIPEGKLANHQPGEFKKPGTNPFVGSKWYVNPYSNALVRSKDARRRGNNEEANLLEKIAKWGGAEWVGDWTAYVENWILRTTSATEKQGALPLYILYNLPGRDCGQYSAGGAKDDEAYRQWIIGVARGINDRKAVVVLEPDGLGLLTKCLTPQQQEARLGLYKFAVETFNKLPQTYVYIDAGHSGWMKVEEAADKLKRAGIDQAEGFALNVSNYRATDDLLQYGKKISALVGGKHFIIDTSRNGNGPPTVTDPASEQSWCNPPGRALGSPPTWETADPLCDAYLWLKKPGESDGTCNGGPKAGEWWNEQALELSRNAKY
ncbi:MAG TPA: glycoside hydrolase family 6 protein [Polyangiaceae bacterium]